MHTKYGGLKRVFTSEYKWILKEQGVKRSDSCGSGWKPMAGACRQGLHKRQTFSWPAVRMFASQRQLCTTELNHQSCKAYVLYVPSGLTYTNSTFCPHGALMLSVRFLEQRVIISLHSINLLVFITSAVCVYCAVRTDAFKCFRFILVKELKTYFVMQSHYSESSVYVTQYCGALA